MSFVPDSWRCGGQQCGEQGGGNRGREDEAGGGNIGLYIFFFFCMENLYKIFILKVRQSERERREKYRRQEEEREQVGHGPLILQ